MDKKEKQLLLEFLRLCEVNYHHTSTDTLLHCKLEINLDTFHKREMFHNIQQLITKLQHELQ